MYFAFIKQRMLIFKSKLAMGGSVVELLPM